MSRNTDDFDQILDQTLEEIQLDELSPQAEKDAADRVWARVSEETNVQKRQEEAQHRISDCSDFQALIPAYLRGGLNEAKALLLKDHVTGCVPCRKALKVARDAQRRTRTETVQAPRSSVLSTWTWRIAAAAVIIIGLVGLSVQTDVLTIQTGGLIHIEAVDGEVFQVTDEGSVPLNAGDAVSFEDAKLIRTGKDSNAMLRLADDSMVEMSERAELSVQDRRKIWNYSNSDAVVDINRGTVIVEASEQGSGHLYVDTPDALVAVTGTVFAVNSGMKGSRVTVLEGEVEVAHSGELEILHPGQQTTTHPALGQVPIAEEIAWSTQLDRHLALLAEFAELGQEIDRQIQGPGVRYGTTLLDRVPSDTRVYVAIPNLSTTLGQAYDIMQEKISDNELLQGWWNDSVVANGADGKIELAMAKIRSYGQQIGDEIVVTVGSANQQGADPGVLILAEVSDPQMFVNLLRADLAGLELLVDEKNRPDIVLLDEQMAGPEASDLYVWATDGFVAISPRVETIRAFGGVIRQGGASEFYGTSFHDRLAELYSDGVEWVIGVDVEGLTSGEGQQESSDSRDDLEALGILDLQHVIGQHKDLDETAETRAVLSFNQTRRGIASWLAEPAPMGALDFVSRNAYFAAGFVMKEPAQVVDEMIEFLGSEDPDFVDGMNRFETEYSIDIREDIAAAIGGEFAFALDGPVLPKPSWKLIVEVYDPARLQGTLEWAVGRLNDLAGDHGKQGFRIEQLERGGRTYYELQSLDTGISAHYIFADGYLIASASRALLDLALQSSYYHTTPRSTSPGWFTRTGVRSSARCPRDWPRPDPPWERKVGRCWTTWARWPAPA
jgi:ferric-dicitrate binding protein FerR (iron transport regulator)